MPERRWLSYDLQKQMQALQRDGKQKELTMLIGSARERGYTVECIARGLGITDVAVYRRLKTYKRWKTQPELIGTNSLKGTTKSVEIPADQRQILLDMWSVAQTRPRINKNFERWEQWRLTSWELDHNLSLCYMQGVTMTYLAQLLGITVTTVRRRIIMYRQANPKWETELIDLTD